MPMSIVNVHSSRCASLATYNANRVIEGEAANGKDFADGDEDIAQEENLHLPVEC